MNTQGLGYDFYYIGYVCGYLSLDDIRKAVNDGDLTKDQYKQITGLDF